MGIENKIIKILIALIIIFIVSVAIFETITGYFIPENKYKDANTLMKEEKFEEAIASFEEIEEYKDSKNKITQCNNKIKEKKLAELAKYVGKYDNTENQLDPIYEEEIPYGNILEILKVDISELRFSFGTYGRRASEISTVAQLTSDNVYTFTFTDTWNNKGNGTIQLLEDSIKVHIDIPKYDEMANFAVSVGNFEFKLSDKTQNDM